MAFIQKLLASLRGSAGRSLQPEASYRVAWDDQGLECTTPAGEVCRVAWKDLRSVRIRTTDTGPFSADVFWLLEDGRSLCVVPQGAEGEAQLLKRLQQLPGFDSEQVIVAMGSTDNADFLCWQA